MKKICVWGAGWSGLTAALEASESPECEVHLYEASNRLGGKACGTVDSKNNIITTHAIRLITEYYHAFADICSRIPIKENQTLLERLSPIDAMNFISIEKNKTHVFPRKLDKEKWGKFRFLLGVFSAYKLKFKDLTGVRKALKKFRTLTETQIRQMETDKVSMHDFLSDYNLSKTAKDFIFVFLGIVVAARPTSMASISMDLMSKLFMGAKRPEQFMTDTFKNDKVWVVDGPIGDRLIPPFEQELRKRGVHIHLNAPLAGVKQDENDQTTAVLESGEQVFADAHIIALNNKVLEKLELGRKGKPLYNEWSFGAIYPLKELPTGLKGNDFKSLYVAIESPWAIAYIIWSRGAKGLWSQEVEFPEGCEYLLEVVSSRMDYKGQSNKNFFECTPDEASKEILTQIGLDTTAIEALYKDIVFCENLTYTNTEEEDTLSLYSKPNADGYRWKLYAPIYTASGETPPLAPITEFKHTYLCGEAIQIEYPYTKIPTLELCSETSKAAVQQVFDDLGIEQQVFQEYPERFALRQK
ncbi:MAG: FAD-dependent oxidoreductase [Aureispira sp.]